MINDDLTKDVVAPLASAFHEALRAGPAYERLGHHLAHVAPESWLAQEFAFTVNTQAVSLGLSGWSATLERQKVDVTLEPPAKVGDDSGPIYLEFKLTPTHYWTNWREVCLDLALPGFPARSKPKADLAVCFLIHILHQPAVGMLNTGTQQAITCKREQLLARVPETPGTFVPAPTLPSLSLVMSSAAFETVWLPPPPRAEYRTSVRVLWVTRDESGAVQAASF